MDSIVLIILAAALIGVAFYVVALPLLRAPRGATSHAEAASGEQERLAELLAQRDAAFQALRELNFDHRVGKISDEDFSAFEANLKRHAAETLRALDAWEAEAVSDIDTVMERAISTRKSTLGGAPGSAPALSLGGRTCGRCGEPAVASDRFCGKCGSPLSAPAPKPAVPAPAACPGCGQAYETGDKFCARCGQSLAVEAVRSAQ